MFKSATNFRHQSQPAIGSREDSLFDKSFWLNVIDAAIYLRRFNRITGKPSRSAIYMLVQRGALRPKKYRGMLYFNPNELFRIIDSSSSGSA